MTTWKQIAATVIAGGALLLCSTAIAAPNCPGADKSAKKDKKKGDDKGDNIVESACPGADKSAKKDKKKGDDKGDGLI